MVRVVRRRPSEADSACTRAHVCVHERLDPCASMCERSVRALLRVCVGALLRVCVRALLRACVPCCVRACARGLGPRSLSVFEWGSALL